MPENKNALGVLTFSYDDPLREMIARIIHSDVSQNAIVTEAATFGVIDEALADSETGLDHLDAVFVGDPPYREWVGEGAASNRPLETRIAESCLVAEKVRQLFPDVPIICISLEEAVRERLLTDSSLSPVEMPDVTQLNSAIPKILGKYRVSNFKK